MNILQISTVRCWLIQDLDSLSLECTHRGVHVQGYGSLEDLLDCLMHTIASPYQSNAAP